MKIKSLLLGSAAALVAVSGAQAADAIIVEPEPMEYVKVCDMYGAGYFYIPGTETCLKIGGHVRVEYRSFHYHDDDYNTESQHRARVRARVGFDAKNETEYGTLSSSIVTQFGWVEDADALEDEDGFGSTHDYFSASEGYDAPAGLVKATINLAGFRVGFDSDGGDAWNRYTGYGYKGAIDSGYYTFNSAIFLEYGGSAGGVNYAVGIQDSARSGSAGQPDVYAAMNTTFSGLTLGAAVIYDTDGGYDYDDDEYDGDGGIAYRIRADYDMSSFISGGSIGMWYENDHGQTDYVKGHKWGVTMQANVTDKIYMYTGYSAYNQHDSAVLETGADYTDWVVGMGWNVVSGLEVKAEWGKTQANEDVFAGDTENSQDRFSLRIQRSF